MKAEVKAQWVAALRSGDYVQGHSRLVEYDFSGNSFYCCLGVLCDLAVKAGVEGIRASRAGFHVDVHPIYNDGPIEALENGYLPPVVQEWAEVDGHNPMAGSNALAAWNDQRAVDFDRIADLIEEHL